MTQTASLQILRTVGGFRVRDMRHGMWVSETTGITAAWRNLERLVAAGYAPHPGDEHAHANAERQWREFRL